jgi:hypothetical protein
MALFDVQRDTQDGRIVSIRPANYWRDLRKRLEAKTDGRRYPMADDQPPFAITQEDLGIAYLDKVEISLERGGDGLTKTRKDLIREAEVLEAPEKVAAVLTVEQIEAEIVKRGYKPLTLADAIEAVK